MNSISYKSKLPPLDWEAIAGRLRQVRGQTTQVELGLALGVPQNAVSRYELGRLKPPLEYIVAAAGFGKVSLDWLVLGKELSHSRQPKKGR